MSIKVNGVFKNYGEQAALEGVEFEVPSGKVVGFLGPNGAGKSTMMKILAGVIYPDQGTIELLGKDFQAGDPNIQQKVGYLAENNPLYMDQYVREYLNFCAGLYKISNPSARIEEVIELTGLGPESHKLIGQLSKGYKQRVGLAQAILHDPDILILDEPTTGLDPNQLVSIRALIAALGKQKTVLFSTHILQEVEALCEEVILLDRGRIIHQFSMKKWKELYPESENLESVFIELTKGRG